MQLDVKGGALSVTADPSRGGKVTSLRDETGYEWLTQRGAATTDPGSAFTDAEMAGWDECAPSIVECEVNGVVIPDHGDLWDANFRVAGDTLSAIGHTFGYRFERTILQIDDGVRFAYRATAGLSPVPFLWAAHPQFRAPRGSRVSLQNVDSVIDVMADGHPSFAWNDELATVHSLPPGGTRKLYVPPDVPVSNAAIILEDGRGLSLSWPTQCPYLGIWFDNCRYSQEPVIALEPSTGYFDSLDRAIAYGRAPIIDPGEVFEWFVDVRLMSR